jgi:hypothetical protein
MPSYSSVIDQNFITIFENSTPRRINATHAAATRIKELLARQDFPGALRLMSPSGTLQDAVQKNSDPKLTYAEGNLQWSGASINADLQSRIVSALQANQSIAPFINFLNKCDENPLPAAIARLYEFVSHRSLQITNDGDILGYKNVRTDFHDHHTGKYDYTPGNVVIMDRVDVEYDPQLECSRGLHFACLTYAKGFHPGNPIVIVRVNPADIVSIPNNDPKKARACRLESIGIYNDERAVRATYDQIVSVRTASDTATLIKKGKRDGARRLEGDEWTKFFNEFSAGVTAEKLREAFGLDKRTTERHIARAAKDLGDKMAELRSTKKFAKKPKNEPGNVREYRSKATAAGKRHGARRLAGFEWQTFKRDVKNRTSPNTLRDRYKLDGRTTERHIKRAKLELSTKK